LLSQAAARGLMHREERQIFDTSHVLSNTRLVSNASLLLDAWTRVVREVARADAAFGAELAAQQAGDRAAYRAERLRQREAGAPSPSRVERTARAVDSATKALAAVRDRVRAGAFAPTDRVNVAVAVLAKAVVDRADGATERLVSAHDPEAR